MRLHAWGIISLAAAWICGSPVLAADPGNDSAAAAAYSDEAKKSAEEAKKSADDVKKAREDVLAEARKIPNDASNYLGDKIVFKTNVLAEVSLDGENWEKEKVCIRHGSYLQGTTQGESNAPEFTPDCNWGQFFSGWCSLHFCDDKHVELCGSTTAHTEENCTLKDGCIPEGAYIRIPAETFTSNPPNRYGWTYGGLVVPFKLQLSGKHEFKGSASAAPYMGYRFGFEQSGIELALVGFAGVGNVEATKSTTTQTATGTVTSDDTSQLAAFSYGAGLVGVLKNSFQFGVMIGFDHVGSGQGYDYNDKPWLGLELGYAWQ